MCSWCRQAPFSECLVAAGDYARRERAQRRGAGAMAPERGRRRNPDHGLTGRNRGEVELAAAAPQEVIGASGDDEVVARARAGDQEAWGIVYDRLHRPLLGYLRGRDCPDPENALGEVFLRLARSLGRFSGGMAGLRAYAFTVAQNYLRDLARARRTRLAITFLAPDALADAGEGPPAASAEDDALGPLSLWSLRAAFAELTPEQRHVLYLRIVGDLSIEDTAKVVGKSRGAVKQLQHRAMDRLRALLGAPGQPAPEAEVER